MEDTLIFHCHLTYRIQIVGGCHGFRVLRPSDAVLHHGWEWHCLQLFHVGTSIDHFLLVLSPPATPHTQQYQGQDDNNDSGYRCANGHAQDFTIKFTRLPFVVSLAPGMKKQTTLLKFNSLHLRAIELFFTSKFSCHSQFYIPLYYCSKSAYRNCTDVQIGMGHLDMDQKILVDIDMRNCLGY